MSIYYPSIKSTKSYITLFKYRLELSRKYIINITDYNKVTIDVKLNEILENDENSNIKYMKIILYFDDKDNIITIIDTNNLDFYNGYFYNEVILPRKDNEAWEIIKIKYDINQWIEKYIFFILNAPKTLICLNENTL